MTYRYKIPVLLCLVLLNACGSMPMPGKSSLAATQRHNDKLASTQDEATPLQNLKMPVASRPIGSSSSVAATMVPQRPLFDNLQDNSLSQISPQKVMPGTGKMPVEVPAKNSVVGSSNNVSTELSGGLEQGIDQRATTGILLTTVSETSQHKEQGTNSPVDSLGMENNVTVNSINSANSSTKKPVNNAPINTHITMLNKSQVNATQVSPTQSSPAQVSPPNVDDIKFNLAQRYFNSGKYQNSIDIIESIGKEGLKKDKIRGLLVVSYTKYARKLESKAELLEAQTVLEKALGMEPNNKQLTAQLAGVKNIRESNRLYEVALESYNAGKKDVAFKSFRHILSLNPNHVTAKKYYERMKSSVVDGFHKKALQFYRHQQLSQAIEEWDQLLEVDPANELAKLYRTRALELKRKFERL